MKYYNIIVHVSLLIIYILLSFIMIIMIKYGNGWEWFGTFGLLGLNSLILGGKKELRIYYRNL